MQALSNKWDQIYSTADKTQITPAQVLVENAFLLPKTGLALDLACGLGANAMFLAKQGLKVMAWDISSVAISWLASQALAQGLPVEASVKAVELLKLEKPCFDVVIIGRFLDRTLKDAIIGALKDGGLLFYQTYTFDKTSQRGPNNPAYLLADNELLELFSPLKVLFYRENGQIGNSNQGLRGEAQFIGQKRICGKAL
ncbi:MAG: methyltransferase domain-containing protein [Methylococcaceae bacterium]|jgi:2-polyprenyl-3-methyl-5-hydroxy-6-metoxy-1,4-benzoquinol methylase